jgi:hypothetical protein
VEFAPAFQGLHSCTLTVRDDIASVEDSTLAVNGTGEAASIVLAPIGMMVFSDQEVGTTSSAMILTLTNAGDLGYDLDVTSIAMSGDAANDFALDGFSIGTVGPGASVEIEVSFAPTATGPRNAEILIETSEPSGLGAARAVTGDGIPNLQLILRSGFEESVLGSE